MEFSKPLFFVPIQMLDFIGLCWTLLDFVGLCWTVLDSVFCRLCSFAGTKLNVN